MAAKKNSKQKAKRKRQIRRIITAVFVAAVICAIAGSVIYLTVFRTYRSYNVKSSVELGGSSENVSYMKYAGGYIKCSNDGIVYFDKSSVTWSESFAMNQPLIDVCGDYIVAADMKHSDVYIFNRGGLYKHFNTTHDIVAVEVSAQGVIALSTNDGNSNYIELKDKDGNDLINIKSIFATSGYLTDITLSSDAKKLAAAYINVFDGAIGSRVVFYDFNKDSDNMLVGGFNQYIGTVLTNVEFLGDNKVCAVGDNAISFYDFKETPAVITESLDLEWEIQNLSFDKNQVLLVIKDDSGEKNYIAKVYDARGEEKASVGFDFAYSTAEIAGKNILLYSATDCQMFSFAGKKKLSYSFDDRIEYMLATSSSRFILGHSGGSADFISLK